MGRYFLKSELKQEEILFLAWLADSLPYPV